MTLLQPNLPELGEADNFRLEYHGTYGTVYADPENVARVLVDLQKGPIPKKRFLWDGRDYLGGMEPEQAKLVPFDVVRLFWGDPRSIPSTFGRTTDAKGRPGDIPPREQEIRRLSVFYGLYELDREKLMQMAPRVTITTAEGTEVICPLYDPDGEHIYGHMEPEGPGQHDIATQIAQMRNQIRLLEQAQSASNGKPNDGADVTDDTPPRARQPH